MIEEFARDLAGIYTKEDWLQLFKKWESNFAGKLPIATTAGMSFIGALTRCLENAERGEAHGVRPVGFKGLVYGWQSNGGRMWILCHVDSGTERYDDNIYFGYFELLSLAKINGEWPIT